MQKYILIVGDYIDGDYDTRISPITDSEIELIRPVVDAIAKNDGAYCNREFATPDDSAELFYGHLAGFKTFDDRTPYGDSNYPGIHTIDTVQIITIIEELL